MEKMIRRTNKVHRWINGTGLQALLLAAVLMAPLPSFAARPLITDDAATVGKGKFQAELGGEWSSRTDREDGVRIKETGTEVSGVFTYGLSESIDLVAGIPYLRGKVREDRTTVFDKNGISDVSVETKWRFLEKDGFGLALKPGLTFPTGDHKKGFGTGRTTFGLTFIASKEMEPFGFHFNTGYTRNENKVDERKDLWSASLAATWKAIKGLNIVGDVGFERNADPTVKTAPAFALVGLNYAVTDAIVLDAGVKFGLNKQEVDRAIIAGITFSF